MAAVDCEIRNMADDPRFGGRAIDSVYFGGGTPSLIDPSVVAALLERIQSVFPLRDAEISLEANPDGLSVDRLRDLKAVGCNRITLGWQSLRAENLRVLTRTHGPEDNRRSLDAARAAGFESVGVDMMFGLPGQSAGEWSAEIEEVARLAPDHVSAYELTLEEGTRFLARNRAGRLELPDEEARACMFEDTEDVLARFDIRRYEISNFARSGHECRHNVCGWKSGDVLGVGASAASHVENARWTNVADLDEYVDRIEARESPARDAEVLDPVTWAAAPARESAGGRKKEAGGNPAPGGAGRPPGSWGRGPTLDAPRAPFRRRDLRRAAQRW
jgi:oxygen-independent coproporphyrinogen-3 oxidase